MPGNSKSQVSLTNSGIYKYMICREGFINFLTFLIKMSQIVAKMFTYITKKYSYMFSNIFYNRKTPFDGVSFLFM